VDAGRQIDLSGKWNDTDVRTVCETLVTGCLNAPRVQAFVEEFRRAHGGRLPVVVVGEFANTSSEHIDTGIIARQMEIAIVNSGMLEFVSGGDERAALRSERQDQLGWASDDTAAALGNETAANLMLTGAVRSIVDRAGGRQVRSYFVSAELTNVETSVRLWMGEDSSIKKDIKNAAYRP
jgi:hypothetical protein